MSLYGIEKIPFVNEVFKFINRVNNSVELEKR